jgi:hydrogenase nickel incorporation protein HypA/HybF
MHEAQIARTLLREVIARASRERARRVLSVRCRIAESEAISRESIALSFCAMAAGTVADGARLELSIVHIEARCRRCHGAYRPEHHVILCPRCGSTEGDLLGPTGLGIASLEIEP